MPRPPLFLAEQKSTAVTLTQFCKYLLTVYYVPGIVQSEGAVLGMNHTLYLPSRYPKTSGQDKTAMDALKCNMREMVMTTTISYSVMSLLKAKFEYPLYALMHFRPRGGQNIISGFSVYGNQNVRNFCRQQLKQYIQKYILII